jgi:NADH-quinone oxidoreductase subunit J
MTLFALYFYLTALMILGSTIMAITRRNPVHAVVYLILSFLGTALLFYILGAPFLAALEVIVYAGAIMTLFLFVIMMLKNELLVEAGMNRKKWFPAFFLGLLYLALTILIISTDLKNQGPLAAATAEPKEFGKFIFNRYWLAVEVISLVLLVGLLTAIQMGKGKTEKADGEAP